MRDAAITALIVALLTLYILFDTVRTVNLQHRKAIRNYELTIKQQTNTIRELKGKAKPSKGRVCMSLAESVPCPFKPNSLNL